MNFNLMHTILSAIFNSNYTPNETFKGQGDFSVFFRSDDSITFRGFNLQYTCLFIVFFL